MFNETLKVQLDLTIGNEKFKIPGGNIKNFRVDLYNYGFEAQVDFWTSKESGEDAIYDSFITPDIISARLSIEGVYNLPTPAPQAFVVKGVGTHRAMTEVLSEYIDEKPVLFRQYSIHFADAAQVLWKQHYPSLLLAKNTLTELVKAQVVEGITLEMDLPAMEVEHPMIFLGLDGERKQANFYDFIIWYVRSQNAVWTYDSKADKYKISSTKDATGTASNLSSLEVESLEMKIPETLRHNVNILNGYTEDSKKEEISQDQVLTGLRRDVLLRTPITSQFSDRKSIETTRLKCGQTGAEVVFKHFPTITYRPEMLIKFEKSLWSEDLFAKGKEYRVYEVHLRGSAVEQGPEKGRNELSAIYQVEMTSGLELKGDEVVKVPPFRRPHYPVIVEGKIVSTIGEDLDKTYEITQDSTTSLDNYTVDIPLWSQKIPILFEPDQFPGHFYFPAFKHSRVLVALYFQKAHILRYIDWGSEVPLNMTTQGNHLLFGKNKLSQTSINFIHEDNKPLLNIKRTNDTDTQLIQMQEGGMMFQAQEEEVEEGSEPQFDVTPQVAAAKGELSMKVGGAISGVTSDFQQTQSQVTGELEGAVEEVKGALDGMEGEIMGKMGEVKGEINSALEGLDKSTAELKGAVTQMKSDLMGAMEL